MTNGSTIEQGKGTVRYGRTRKRVQRDSHHGARKSPIEFIDTDQDTHKGRAIRELYKYAKMTATPENPVTTSKLQIFFADRPELQQSPADVRTWPSRAAHQIGEKTFITRQRAPGCKIYVLGVTGPLPKRFWYAYPVTSKRKAGRDHVNMKCIIDTPSCR